MGGADGQIVDEHQQLAPAGAIARSVSEGGDGEEGRGGEEEEDARRRHGGGVARCADLAAGFSWA